MLVPEPILTEDVVAECRGEVTSFDHLHLHRHLGAWGEHLFIVLHIVVLRALPAIIGRVRVWVIFIWNMKYSGHAWLKHQFRILFCWSWPDLSKLPKSLQFVRSGRSNKSVLASLRVNTTHEKFLKKQFVFVPLPPHESKQRTWAFAAKIGTLSNYQNLPKASLGNQCNIQQGTG